MGSGALGIEKATHAGVVYREERFLIFPLFSRTRWVCVCVCVRFDFRAAVFDASASHEAVYFDAEGEVN